VSEIGAEGTGGVLFTAFYHCSKAASIEVPRIEGRENLICVRKTFSGRLEGLGIL